jgi:hypothetical protein
MVWKCDQTVREFHSLDWSDVVTAWASHHGSQMVASLAEEADASVVCVATQIMWKAAELSQFAADVTKNCLLKYDAPKVCRLPLPFAPVIFLSKRLTNPALTSICIQTSAGKKKTAKIIVAETLLMYRVDIGFDPERGYAAVIADVQLERMKSLRGASVEQLMSRLRHIIIDAEGERKHFPKEHGEPSRIITNGS